MKKRVLTVLLCCVSVLLLGSSKNTWTLKGTISIQRAGTVYVSLLNETGFKDHYKPIQRIKLIITQDDIDRGTSAFSFTDIPSGEYSLSAFLDENENGKLDTGILGPVEPWGNYKRARPSMRAPKWDEVKFHINNNIENIVITIE